MSESGISLITLIVTILVIIIIATTVMSTATFSVRETRDTQVLTELRELKEATNRRMIEYEKNPAKNPVIGKRIADPMIYIAYIDNITEEELKDIASELDDTKLDYVRFLNSEDAKELGISSVDENNGYIVDYSTGKIYGNINLNRMRGKIADEK